MDFMNTAQTIQHLNKRKGTEDTREKKGLEQFSYYI